MQRRQFVKNAGLITAAASMPFSILKMGLNQKLRLAFIGVGARGMETLKLALNRQDVVITAICDIDKVSADKARHLVQEKSTTIPKLYTKDSNDYLNLLEQSDIDAVIISTPWEWHTPMALASMKAGKAVGCEVAGATSIEECWDLVRMHEASKVPFMLLENVCYRRDIMAVLNMVRQDVFGELVHLEGGYEHDLRAVKFNNGKQLYGGGVEFNEKGYSEASWRTNHSVYRNADLYPTHGLGPIAMMTNVNRGNRIVSLSSMASKARGLHDYIVNNPNGGPDHPNAKIDFKLGDVVTTIMQTAQGETFLLTHDTNLPRPYSLGFRVQGTKGLWMDLNNGIYVEGISEPHKWSDEGEWLKKYDHPLWHKFENESAEAGHGGMDFFVLNAFIESIKRDEPTPIDVYDHAVWSAVTYLSEKSIAEGGQVQVFPDFTDGKWMRRKPIFALNDDY